ncbi:RNA polymerase sigma factor [Modestobacter sp. VKM Ac-2985]|uniref:RNA polymerase sigma factor n=1 Tax=Modestobacter sp. VKM Ac-2985 TaxID=3004139 RepID=UPI0022ABABF7|nr:sigma-70 family RNA polymerase sigma factor [Modestobacter sp. VKM Ac-2985]MCZ2836557.1 sigma-70 family RNA polymerase sigma factor [Modestobacter sp. VKM Ac-2985]
MAVAWHADAREQARRARAERDRALLAGCRRGDSSAWRALLEDHERLVFSIPLRYGLSHDDAADIAQLTFTELLQSLDSMTDDARLVGWLATVARRQSWRLLERRKRETAVEEVPDRADADPAEAWTRDEWLYEGLLSLDTRCRELLIALYLSEESTAYADVAARLGRPIGSIGPTRARCLKRLHELLGDEQEN